MGVPQGSVLGPLLWITTFDWVLEAPLGRDTRLICYADDVLVLTRGKTPQSAAAEATLSAAAVTVRIGQLGLKVAPTKTEAILFGGGRILPRNLSVNVEGTSTPVSFILKHLGVILDRKLTYKPHIAYVESKAQSYLRALWRILPNLRGPCEAKRRLYVGVMHSIMLYAAPVWGDQLATYSSYRRPLLKLQRGMALRVISAYRTVSYEAALLLARIPPIHLIAVQQKRVYERLRTMAQWGEEDVQTRRGIWLASQVTLQREWRILLDKQEIPGKKVRDAILPTFTEWLERTVGGLSYHLTQLLTGHGSFGEYLHRIGRRTTPDCPHCQGHVDSPDHTMRECAAWAEWRRELQAVVGQDLSWPILVPEMIRSPDKWRAVKTFAVKVLTAKEVAEKEKERNKPEEEAGVS